ncbi:MAG: helix-turn-helix transcriptional regulator [Clostridia bacterium]|nr:helix-turn-helix transcriptional regulator [Clostridia bacterium]
MNIISIRLKELRTQNGLTQSQLATVIGVTQSSIAKWENGKNNPAVKYIILLSKFYRKKVDFLVGLKD